MARGEPYNRDGGPRTRTTTRFWILCCRLRTTVTVSGYGLRGEGSSTNHHRRPAQGPPSAGTGPQWLSAAADCDRGVLGGVVGVDRAAAGRFVAWVSHGGAVAENRV